MRKKISYLTTLLCLFLLTGCGNGASEAATQPDKVQTQDTERTVLTFGYIDSSPDLDLDSNINERIVTFNKGQDKYFIEVIKYGEGSYKDGLNALNADISAKKTPDIIAIDGKSLLWQLGNKGAIEDLYPYIDQDEELSREDFVENTLANFERDGKLYGMNPFFSIWSIYGDPDIMTSDKITFQELKTMYEENKDNDEMLVYNGLNRHQLLVTCIYKSISSFVDKENGKCNFMDERFREILEFSKEFDDTPYSDVSYDSENSIRLMEGTLPLFTDRELNGFEQYTHYRELSGKSWVFMGFPTVDGCNPKITTKAVGAPFLAIGRDSKNKEAAWEFICTFLEDKFFLANKDVNRGKGFPITVSGFERAAQRAVQTSLSNGEASITDDMGRTISYSMEPTTEEEVAYIKEVISRCRPEENYDEIENIISEEILNYWNDTKSVEEVMEIIQNRAQLYLDEQ